ncbi:hypothetical protein D5086_001099 [Populus alba]|uniref:Uncharacterized protein n=3 Tax=Populus TaxID=3689 RepID=A0A4U5P4I7_POPAL|nr:uncharacterized protein LOC118036006 [Populus alba]KAJ7010921.1 hypothetical protein NC653_001386 [Populus alba x Populus x berolinensis]TKR91162.1 uncharacterized protein D5086_0000226730 [Populus alba]
MSTLFLLLLICLSLHACNARVLRLSDKETKKQVLNKDLVQGVDKLNIDRTTLAPSEMMPPVSEEQGAQGQQIVGRDDTITRKISLLSATTMKKKDEEAFMKQEEGTQGPTSGNKVIVSSKADFQQSSEIIIEGLKGRGRSMLGSTANDTEEAVRSEENDIAEDVAVMDYAQPHRKPPIHNKKP